MKVCLEEKPARLKELSRPIEGETLNKMMAAETIDGNEPEAAVGLAPHALRFEDLPDFLTVQELRDWLRIGSNTAYALAKKPGFPVMRWGTKLVFPKDQVRDWVRREVERSKLPRRLRAI